MLKPFIRLFAFFAKELAEVRRQPRLLLSLVLGPFLILLIFGLGFSGEQPRLRTILVVPPENADDPRIEQFRDVISRANFDVVEVMNDEQTAVETLRRNQGLIDVVEVLPPNMEQMVGRKEPAQIKVIYNEIDPTQAQWIQYLSYVQVKELNTALLVSAVSGSREQAGSMQQFIASTRQELDQIQAGLSVAQNPQTRAAIQRLRNNNGLILAGLALSAQSSANETAQSDVQSIQRSLDALDQAVVQGSVEEQRRRVEEINGRLSSIEQVASQIESVPPEVLVSPLQGTPQNVAQQQPSFIAYYAPGVLALLLQHMAVTLASLSLVRENLLGSTELFRVAPVSSLQIILGKYIGFILFIGIIVSLLVGLMVANLPIGNTGFTFGLAVPFVGNALWFAVAVLLVTVAALGLGFLISSISKSESQAVQLSMISLLASVFFSGFFLPLRNFAAFAQWLAFLLPVTHGVQAFQNIMLRGLLPTTETFAWLGGIALVCFLLAWTIWRSNLKGGR
jgi:ABC-2 type transport system permease protein